MYNYKTREVRLDDLQTCVKIEASCYPPQEAATQEKIKNRIKTWSQGFIVLEIEDEVIGFINGGSTNKCDLSDEAFKDMVGHEDDGENVAIFSVVLNKQMQGKGLATPLIRAYIEQMRKLNKKNILLICKKHLISFYEKFAFTLLGESHSTHGGAFWYEMQLNL